MRFLIVGNITAALYRDVWPLIRDGEMWFGCGFDKNNAFFSAPNAEKYGEGVYQPDTGLVKFRNVRWFTNIDHGKRNAPLRLTEVRGTKYQRYDNYDAIEIPRVKDIPADYPGVMGVPITFLDKYCPEQFEIIGLDRYVEGNTMPNKRMHIDGREIYARVLVRHTAASLAWAL